MPINWDHVNGSGGKNLDYSEGFSSKGVNDLVTEIKAIVLSGAGQRAINDVKIINDVCDQYWDGEAKERFKKNLEEDARIFYARIIDLTGALIKEIDDAGHSYSAFDQRMFE